MISAVCLWIESQLKNGSGMSWSILNHIFLNLFCVNDFVLKNRIARSKELSAGRQKVMKIYECFNISLDTSGVLIYSSLTYSLQLKYKASLNIKRTFNYWIHFFSLLKIKLQHQYNQFLWNDIYIKAANDLLVKPEPEPAPVPPVLRAPRRIRSTHKPCHDCHRNHDDILFNSLDLKVENLTF